MLNGELSVDGGALLMGLVGALVVGRWVVVVVVEVVVLLEVGGGGGRVLVLLVVVVTGAIVVVRVGYPLVGCGL